MSQSQHRKNNPCIIGGNIYASAGDCNCTAPTKQPHTNYRCAKGCPYEQNPTNKGYAIDYFLFKYTADYFPFGGLGFNHFGPLRMKANRRRFNHWFTVVHSVRGRCT